MSSSNALSKDYTIIGANSYCVIKQDDADSIDKEGLMVLDRQLNDKKEEVQLLKTEISSLEGEIKALNSALTDEEIDARIAMLTEDVKS